MPSPRRRSKSRLAWDRIHYYIAASGNDFFGTYSTEEEMREAYFQVEADLLADFIAACPGQRPRLWWRYHQDRFGPDPERQPEVLRELGELTPEEEAILAEQGAEWQPKDFPSKAWAATQAGD